MTPQRLSLQGIWPALLTPLTPSLAVDTSLLGSHARRLLEAGCAGVTLFGTTGEGPSFSLAERMAALKALVDSGIPASQIIVHTSCAALPETVALTAHATSLGVRACLVLPPFFLKGVPDQGVLDAYRWIIDQVADPSLQLLLYHIPQVSGVGLSLWTISELVSLYPQTVVGIKDSGCDRVFSVGLANALMPPLQVWVGNELDLQTLSGLGSRGAISGVANIFPRLVARLVDQPQGSEAAADLERVQAFLNVIGGYGMTAAFKGVMSVLDSAPGWRRVRPPLVALSDSEFERLQSQWTEFQLDRSRD
jgi:4-hydroxy-tetrahydrodipicolinate synthase